MDYHLKNPLQFIERKKDVRMKIIRKIFLLIPVLLLSLLTMAQNKPVEMADTMRSNGRIYVVVAVALTIMAGLILYVFRMDRKLSRLEKESN
jgi:CcmD family protein